MARPPDSNGKIAGASTSPFLPEREQSNIIGRIRTIGSTIGSLVDLTGFIARCGVLVLLAEDSLRARAQELQKMNAPTHSLIEE